MHASTAYGLSSNGSIFNFTDSWNNQNYSNFSSIPFREAWINSTIPEIEQWHDYEAILSDNYGNTDNAFLSVSYDITSPDLFITGIPSITNQQNLIIDIFTEPNSILSIDGENIPVNQNGTAQYILNLTNSQSGQYVVQGEYISFYYLHSKGIYLEQGRASIIDCNISRNTLTGISAISPVNAVLSLQESDLVSNGTYQLEMPDIGSVAHRNSDTINNNLAPSGRGRRRSTFLVE